jgi:hypothetical protein
VALALMRLFLLMTQAALLYRPVTIKIHPLPPPPAQLMRLSGSKWKGLKKLMKTTFGP